MFILSKNELSLIIPGKTVKILKRDKITVIKSEKAGTLIVCCSALTKLLFNVNAFTNPYQILAVNSIFIPVVTENYTELIALLKSQYNYT